MKLVPWYWRERRDLVRRLHQMELEEEEVSGQLARHVLDKGGDFLQAVVHEWVTRDVQQARRRLASEEIRRRRQKMEKTAKRKVAEVVTQTVQPTLDADMFPGPDSTLLAEDEKWLDAYEAQTQRYEERSKLLREVHNKLVSAVGGDKMMPRSAAKKALRQQEATRRAINGDR